MNGFKKGLMAIFFGILFAGCLQHKPFLPVHDQVLVYDIPYDLVYLRVLEGLQSVPGWDLEATVKEAGLIRVRNINISTLEDSDKRTITFLVKRLESGKTSVELAPSSQQTLGGGDLIKAVAHELDRELEK